MDQELKDNLRYYEKIRKPSIQEIIQQEIISTSTMKNIIENEMNFGIALTAHSFSQIFDKNQEVQEVIESFLKVNKDARIYFDRLCIAMNEENIKMKENVAKFKNEFKGGC